MTRIKGKLVEDELHSAWLRAIEHDDKLDRRAESRTSSDVDSDVQSAHD
jgi:hypothetical protein